VFLIGDWQVAVCGWIADPGRQMAPQPGAGWKKCRYLQSGGRDHQPRAPHK
jgi:hypothetical protein